MPPVQPPSAWPLPLPSSEPLPPPPSSVWPPAHSSTGAIGIGPGRRTGGRGVRNGRVGMHIKGPSVRHILRNSSTTFGRTCGFRAQVPGVRTGPTRSQKRSRPTQESKNPLATYEPRCCTGPGRGRNSCSRHTSFSRCSLRALRRAVSSVLRCSRSAALFLLWQKKWWR